jgi:hypothetical protein
VLNPHDATCARKVSPTTILTQRLQNHRPRTRLDTLHMSEKYMIYRFCFWDVVQMRIVEWQLALK